MATKYKVGGKYIVAFFDEHRERHRIRTGVGDKGAAEEIKRKIEALHGLRVSHRLPDGDLAKWVETCPSELRRQLVKEGLIDQSHRQLGELVDDFERHLSEKGGTPGHVEKTKNRLQAIIDGCGFAAVADIDGAKLQRWLAEQREAADPKSRRGFGRATSNKYLAATKQFTKWLVRERVLYADPLVHLRPLNARTDRQDRMALDAKQVGTLLSKTAKAGEAHQMTGADRALLYRLAIETGLRASEIRSLTRASFDLSGDGPTVTIRAAHAKNGRDDTLPLRPETAALLRDHLKHKAPAAPAFGLPRPELLAKMLRKDAEAARVPTTDDTGRRLDFHSLRHTTGTLLAASGAHPKVIQRLMRHGSIELTMDRYTKAFRSDEAAAVANLPDFTTPAESQQAQATGTYDTKGETPDTQREQNRERAPRAKGQQAAPTGALEQDGQASNSHVSGSKMRQLASTGAKKGNADDWTRTSDPGLMNPLLYQLSYVGQDTTS